MTTQVDWTGTRLRLRVGAVAHGGHCVARHEGRVVFVRHALPGELVDAEVTEDRGGSFCRADAVGVIEAAEGRVEPPCSLASIERGTDRCGGCDWQHAEPATQRALKADVLAEQLWRLAGIEHPVEVRPLPGGPLRWRSRVRLAVDEHGSAGFRASRSHRVIPVRDCPITMPGALDEVTRQPWESGSEVEVTKDGDGRVHVSSHRRVAHRQDSRGGNRRGRQRTETETRQVKGSGVAREQAAGREWDVSAHGFWQVHPAAADRFAEIVGRMAATPTGGCAWDLYGGAGLFASVLADQVGTDGDVVVVEAVRQVAADAEKNLADLEQVRIRPGKVDRVLSAGDMPDPDVVVLDPPRKGAGRSVVERIVGAEPDRVVYVACDPAALARDLAYFAEHGYRLGELEAFDSFPMTHHVESIALIRRERG